MTPTYPVHNPARPDEVVHEAPITPMEELDGMVAAAAAAQREWAARPLVERTEAVVKAAEAAGATALAGDLPVLLTREHGKVLAESQYEAFTVGAVAPVFAEYAEEALSPRRTRTSEVTSEPHGVVAAILPFNYPLSVLSMKAVPALLAGNAVVVKAPPTCPGAVLATVAEMAAALPPGLLTAVNGPGPELGEALVTHPGVGMVSFTGGVATGRAVMAGAARNLTPVLLELGGNDAAVLAPDLELTPAVVERLHEAMFLSAGQVCMAVKRLFVPRDRLDEVTGAMAERLSREVVGDGLAEGVTMGPVHTRAARDRAEAFVAEAVERGGRAHRPAQVREDDVAAGGWFVSPALVEAPPPDTALVREEPFAPVVPVVPYGDLDEAVALSNDSPYGLSASVWTADEALAAALAPRLEAGTVWVNHHGTVAVDPGTPFGGWKDSGLGRELGPEGLRAYTRPRTVTRHTLP